MPSTLTDLPGEPGAPSDASTVPAVASRIVAVTMFSSGALVERAATYAPSRNGGPESLRLAGLPLSLDDGTVRVRVEADPEQAEAQPAAPVTVTDVRVALEVPEPDRELAPPRDEELIEARHDVSRLKESIAAAEGMISRLETLAAPPRPRGAYGTPPPPSPAAARLALLDFRGQELERLTERLAELRRELAAAAEHLRQLEDRQRRASTARQAREHELRKSLFVTLRRETGAADARCRLVVRYLVPGARWAPGYTVRFDPGLERVRLALRALVCQATGEDWQGVRLTLSTAEPQRWSELPELKSLCIGRRQTPPAKTGWREPPAGTGELFADYDRERKRLPVPPPAVEQAAAGGSAAAEPVPASASIEDSFSGDADFETVMEELELEADLDDTAEIELSAPPPPATAALSFGPVEPVAAAPAPSAKPPANRRVMAKKRRRRRSPKSIALALPERRAPAPPEPEPGIAAPDEYLDYGRLRLAGAEEPERGKLRPGAGDEDYLELLTLLRVEVRFDVLSAVRRAARKAEQAGSVPAPPGYAYPRAWRGFDHAYAAEAPVDVAADGVFHNLPLLERQTPAELRYVAVPREAPQAFRVASFANPLPAPLPRGPADVYVGEDFLLTSTLDTAAPEAAVELGLGVDEALKLARNCRFREQTSGLIRGRLSLRHEVDVEVANRLAMPVRCEVRERIPIPREGDEEIEVEIVDVEPDWESFAQPQRPVESGYRWRLTLAAGESRTLRLRYVIRLPASHELVGGNRRES